jgi:hypothetical protein
MAETGVGEGVGFFSAPASNNESNQQASTAPTPPMDVPAPLVLPALGEAAKDLVVGAIETLALPFIVLDYLVSPNSGGNSGYRDTTDAPGGPKNSSTTGPKAADAPGVTAGGQATDKFGNKIAPSGETQVNKTKSTTREGARNKALNEGSRAAEHKRDQKMGPHFHPADASGEKKPSSTHHEYPE